MRVLCVAEKPSISKAITQILSGGQFTTHNSPSQFIKNYEFDYPQTRSFFVVTAVVGHLTVNDFGDRHRKWNSCDAFELFDAPVETQIAPDKKTIERNLLTQARNADVLMIWTDCDREGEHIGMEIARVCRSAKPGIRIKRARFSAIIAQQIHNAAQHPVELDRRQADAVEARIFLDLKVGAAFTRLQTLTLQGRVPQIAEEKSIVSYGPCQFPTLGFVVQRYKLVKNFDPETFWYIYLSLTRLNASQGNEETKFNWKRNHLFDQAVVETLYSMMENSLAVVTKVTNKTTKKWKPLPLTTVELQKAGSRLLRLAPKKVLDVAEKLYNQGFVSYPRTETDEFDPQFDHMSLIGKQTVDPAWGEFATSLQQGGYTSPRKGKHNDKAHPPIHPTAHANNLNGDEKKVYEYITRRYLACCSKDAEGWQTTVDVMCGGEEFIATGLVVKEKNYLNVYIYEKWNGHYVPDFQEGEEFEPTTCEVREGQTSRPNYLTEADLVTLMDKNGIGTDATIAQHIETIIDRHYVIERLEGATKYLVPSTLGIGLIEGYNQIGLAKNVSKPQLRRETERRMVQVCEGTTTKNDMLVRSLDQYKEMFIIVRREFERVTASVRRYLAGEGEPQNEQGGAGGQGPGGGGGGGGGNGGPGGGGRGGARGRPASRATRGTVPAGRGRGRGGAPNAGAIITVDDSDDDNDPDMPLPRTTTAASSSRQAGSSRTAPVSSRTSSAVRPSAPVSTSSTAVASSSRQTAPLYVSPTWQATPVASTSSAKPASSRTSGAPMDDAVKCGCDLDAVERTVVRDTASKGKKFWGCTKGPSGCGFFQWVEDGHAAGGSRTASGSIPAKRSHSSTRDASTAAEPPMRSCKCDEDAILFTVQKDNDNKGRRFWKCRKADHASCGFFEWADEPPQNGGSGIGGGRTSSRTQSLNTSSNDAGSSTTCFKCNETGHWANECPNGDGSSSKRSRSFGTNANDNAASNNASSSTTCFKCNETGHWANECPNGDGSSNKRSKSFGTNANDKAASATCFKCQQPGHYSSACPSGAFSKGKSSFSGADTSAACFKCQQSGHYSSACPNGASSKSKSNFSGADASDNPCFKCGQTGHWSAKCPQGSGAGSSKRSSSSGGSKRGRGSATASRGKRGRGGKKKSAFGAADGY